MASSPVIDVLVSKFNDLGEGPHWDEEEQCLYYIDIIGRKVCRFDYKTKENKFIQLEGEDNVSLIVPIVDGGNSFVISRGRNICKLKWDHIKGEEHSLEVLVGVDEDRPRNRFNDGKCDSSGRLWAGTMGYEAKPAQVEPNMGNVFRIHRDPESGFLNATKEITGVNISNGLCWSEDNSTFYYIDTLAMSVDAFDFDDVTGKINNRRIVFDFKKNGVEGFPDGMTIDTRGHLWVACFGSGQVVEIDPGSGDVDSGHLVSKIEFPAKNVTSVAFGGPDLTDLLVTSAKWNDPDSCEAGSLFKVSGLQGAKGLPANKFKLQ